MQGYIQQIGFTGTSRKLVQIQKTNLREALLEEYSEAELIGHHGDCIEGDAFFHDLVRELFSNAKIVIHPPLYNRKRAFKQGNIILAPEEYLVRNKHIVDCSIKLFATPFEDYEIMRSGVWSTIRYARRKNVPVRIFYPNGNIEK